jgi:glycosyltransferase involved in cell wall biosynthesis
VSRATHPSSEAPAVGLELTVLMPCLNEAETVGVCVGKARRYLERSGIRGEVLVVDNGSTDGSRAIAEAEGARVVHESGRGYGRALRRGIQEARGRWIIMGDADDSYDFSDLTPFVEKLDEGYDLVMGNRFAGGIEPGAMPPLHRYLGNPVLSFFGRLFFSSEVGDFHCGLRGFDRDAALGLGLTTDGMEFASELVVKSTLADYDITEVPITLSPDGRTRAPHLRSWRDGWRHLRFLLLFSPKWLFMYPGIGLALLSLGSMIWLTGGNRTVGPVRLGVNTLVYSGAGIVAGAQLIAFAIFAYLFAVRAGLRPPDPRMRWLDSDHLMEVGLTLSAVLLLLGLGAAIWSVGVWGEAGFGPLEENLSLRIVVPAATALVLAVQIGASSFFIGVLGLRTSAPPVVEPLVTSPPG